MPIYEVDGSPQRLRFPRKGHIRLGTKVAARNGGERPSQAEHFVLKEEDNTADIVEKYGNVPTEMIIQFPGEDVEVVASHWQRMYSQTHGLVCMGDGLKATRTIAQPTENGEFRLVMEDGRPDVAHHDDENIIKYQVPCRNAAQCGLYDSGACKETMYIRFFLPDIDGTAIWQMNIQGKNSIMNLEGALEILRMTRGGISGIRLKLSYLPASIPRPNGGFQTKRVLFLETEETMTTQQLEASRATIVALMPHVDIPEGEFESAPEDSEDQEPAPQQSVEDAARAAGHAVVDAAPAAEHEEPPPPADPQDPPEDEPPAAAQSSLTAEQQETLKNAQTKPLTVAQQRKLNEVRALCEELGVPSPTVVEYIANTFAPKEGAPPTIWELKAPQTKMLLDWLRLEFAAPVSQETSEAPANNPESQAPATTPQTAAAATIAEADQANADNELEKQAGFGF